MLAAFVAPYLLQATNRFIDAAARLPGVDLALITQEPVDRVPPELRQVLAAHWPVDDALDPGQLAAAVRGLSAVHGPVHRVLAALEQLQEPLAQVREALGIEGMDVATAHNVRDKSRMKSVLQAAGVPCARHRLVTHAGEASAFVDEVGFPLVAKPPAGAGAQGTFRLDDGDGLAGWLQAAPPSPERPALLEEFVVGEEHSFDSVALGGDVVWYSVSDYRPSPLEVLRNPWIQWVVLLPRDAGDPRYDGIRSAGPAALRALGVRTALTHMEWFARPDGSVAISEVAARPPGAQITSLLSYAHDRDFYRAWAELLILDRFDPPERRWAVGAAYLRGHGRGRIRAVHGLAEVQQAVGNLVVESRLPSPGELTSSSYEGDGYVIVRAPDTETVSAALHLIVTGVRVENVEAG